MDYKFYTYEKNGCKITACTTRYHDRTIKGIAKCHPDDNYDETLGRMIAQNRCESKLIAQKLKTARNTKNRYMERLSKDIKNNDSISEYIDALIDRQIALDERLRNM